MPDADGSTPVVPVAVLDADLAGGVPAVPGNRTDGVRVARAWVLVRSHGYPLGALVLDVPRAGLTSQDVEAAARARFSPTTGQRLSSVEGTAPAVVICTRQRPAQLARALASLRSQTVPPDRVVVVDSGATGGATRTVAQEAGAEYVPAATPGLAQARNTALRHCQGQAIAWLDDDEIADDHWLAEATRALTERPDVDVICGAVVPAELETPAQLWFEALGGMVAGRGFTEATFGPTTRDRFHPLYPLPAVGAGANMVTRPGVVEGAGGFDPALGAGTPARGGEDTLLFTQVLWAGGTVLYRPSLLTRHFHRRDPGDLYAQLLGYGTGLTAMYAALLCRQPDALWSLLALAPRALRHLAGGGPRPETEPATEVPAHLRRALRRGMPAGPAAYLRGRRSVRLAARAEERS